MEILRAIAWGFAFAITYAGAQHFYSAHQPEIVITGCIPADAVEETPRQIVDAWFSGERCKDVNAEHCGE